MIDEGVPIEIEGYGRTTPLFSAVEKGKLNAVDLLVSLGANVNVTDQWSST